MGQEQLDLLKEEIKNDLGKGYYKMSQAKLIALIGCTVSVCLSIFGGVLYLDRELTTHTIQINQHSIDIQGIKQTDVGLWNECSNLQNQINQQARIK